MDTMSAPPVNAPSAELIRWAFEMLNQHNVSPLRQFWTDETVERFPDRTCHGAEEISRYFNDAFTALPDFHMEVLAIAQDSEDVFVHWRLTGTHEGSWQGLDPTHKRVQIDGMDHFVIRDSRVVSNFVVFDQMQYARQIGMLPPEGSGRDKAVKGAFNAWTKLAAKIRR